jgi:Na+-transporting NADH:ubiquinone oxidoreductase subunit NqrB
MPNRRVALARFASRQAASAVALSICAFGIGAFGLLVAPVVAGMAAFFAVSFWALGGLVPFTVSVFLRAQPRGRGAE